MSPAFSRRRFIGITAAAAGLSLLPLGRRPKAQAHMETWQGEFMGAVATMQVHHHDQATARRLIARSLEEVRRLEQVFNLYRDDSALVALNRQGFLIAPPPLLVDLLSECRRCWSLTGGAFDPTVQALWILYRDHFSGPAADPDGPPMSALRRALERGGFGQVAFDANRIVLPRRGMGLTLNGIAQGYATDRVVGILRESGITSSLVDMGEPRALGCRPSGDPWRVGIADPDRPERIGDTFEAVDQAIATSGGYGFRFDAAGRFNHLFDPRTGLSAQRYRSVTTVMPTATSADALSTAFSLMAPEDISRTLRQLGTGQVRLITASEETLMLRA